MKLIREVMNVQFFGVPASDIAGEVKTGHIIVDKPRKMTAASAQRAVDEAGYKGCAVTYSAATEIYDIPDDIAVQYLIKE